MLQQEGKYNDFSQKFRDELEKKIDSFGKRARYIFDISHPNPDPTNYNGTTIYPSAYTLDPVTFDILDPYEDRKDKQKLKKVGLVESMNDKGEMAFSRIRVFEGQKGVVLLDLETYKDRELCAYLELHPKLKGGQYQDKARQPKFNRIDEKKLAEDSRSTRVAKTKALQVATNMSEVEVKQFADAMMWGQTDDIVELRDRVEQIAETNPVMFNDLVNSKALEYQATVKRALDNQFITLDPSQGKYMWAANQQVITMLGQFEGDKNEVERLAEWLMTNGSKGDEVYKKLKSLVKEQTV